MSQDCTEALRIYRLKDIDVVHGVTFDGNRVWFASGSHLNALDPGTGHIQVSHAVPANAGTAFDGTHIYQLSGPEILKIEPVSGEVIARLHAPAGAGHSGMAWAEGSLWIGHYAERRIYEVDPASGEVRRILSSDRCVTGVSWAMGELWHATGDPEGSDLRRIDPRSGAILGKAIAPAGTHISGIEFDGKGQFYFGFADKGAIGLMAIPEGAAPARHTADLSGPPLDPDVT